MTRHFGYGVISKAFSVAAHRPRRPDIVSKILIECLLSGVLLGRYTVCNVGSSHLPALGTLNRLASLARFLPTSPSQR